MKDLLKVKCVSVNESMQYVPMSCELSECPASCELRADNTMIEISAKCEGRGIPC